MCTERGGFVVRERDADDRRRVLLRVAPARERLSRLVDPPAGALGEITEGVSSPELQQLVAFVSALRPAVARESGRLRGGAGTVGEGAGGVTVERGALGRSRLNVIAGLFDVVIGSGGGGDQLFHSTFDGQQPRIQQEGATITLRQRRLSLYFGWAGPGVIELSDAVTWDLALRGGAYRLRLDLRRLRVGELSLRGGHEITIALPEPAGTVPLALSGGVDTVTLDRPRGTALRVSIQGGAAELAVDDLQLGAVASTAWQTPDWSAAADRYDLTVVGGANHLHIGTS